ncbi:MAG: MarR family transcriptional regulator [Alphaproteobacteria bacterium]|jgi:DNA-binding MarR family transcriptional regulator|nr:MarR family transcriptional regulator [Alphaproteobacteria bacterium]
MLELLDEPAEATGFLLWQVENLWQRRQRAALGAFDLTPVQFLLLSGLAAARREGSVKQAALARRCRTDPMMTSQVLRVLEKAGLVERTSHARDGRALSVGLTQAGMELVRRAAPAVEEVERAVFAVLGADVPAFSDALRLLLGARPRRRIQAGTG